MLESGNAVLVTPRALNTSLAGAKPMPVRKPITVGLSFGRLTVTALSTIRKTGHYCYECACSCGKAIVVKASSLQSGETESCGCLKNELTSARTKTHGHARQYTTTTSYRVWKNMVARCQNERSTSYPWYGARGIKVCERWLKFENFLADMGDRPSDRSIDRINNDGHYEPSNCRWATKKEQSANRRNSPSR